MKKLYFLFFTFLITSLSFGQTVFINEIHYDNSSTDENEGFEIAGPLGTDLTGYSVVLYNGNDGAMYNTIALSGTIPDLQNGYGVIWFDLPVNGLQNGGPDGLALIGLDGTTVIQFLSYEGSFDATDGPANGTTSVDIGVSEGSSTLATESLQLTGTGTVYTDFTWSGPSASSFNAINSGQTFSTTAAVAKNEIAMFSVFPNPITSGKVYINTEFNAEKQIQVFDILGKQVMMQTLKGRELNVSSLRSGVYILKVMEDGKTATRKLIIN